MATIDVERKYSNLSQDKKTLYARSCGKKDVKYVSEQVGTPVMNRWQTEETFYLMGREQRNLKEFRENVLPIISKYGGVISGDTYDVPEKSKPNWKEAYTVDSVRKTAIELDDDFELVYSPNDFDKALEFIVG